MSDPSPRRVKQVRILSIFTFCIGIFLAIVFRQLGQVELSNWLFVICSSLLPILFFIELDKFVAARMTYIVMYNFGVTACASFVGQPGSMEFMLLFALGLPFLMFSFRNEKVLLLVSTFIPIAAWVLLFTTDFNLLSTSKMDPVVAAKKVYPVAILSTSLLVTFQVAYFAYLNAQYYGRVHRKRIEAEEASTAKSRFLSTMSHEIRTPLNAIIGLSHILRENNPREDQMENVEALNYSGKLLLQLLNNVLDYSKMEAREFQLDSVPTDLNISLRQLKKMHEPNCVKKGIGLEVEIDKNIPLVWIDVVRFNQVLNNLINNAIKFTESGGVTVRLKKVNERDNDVGLTVEVIDTGAGIPEDKQASIFEAFKQADASTQRVYGGTGLGLSIVKEIVELMGSHIDVKSRPGGGSTFRFELLLNKVSDAQIAEFEQKAEHNLRGVRTLLVEDNVINEMVGRQILEKEGLIVESASDGKEAVEYARKNNYDIILMDIQMPIMDGYQASAEIRKFNPDIPILALSASVFMEVKDKIFESGMNGFVFKPFDPDNLFDRIAACVKN